MAIYDDLANIIKGKRGDRLDMMIPLLLATVSTLADARWEWIGAPSITVFLGVFGLVYAIWRIIAICLKKLSGEWYRDRFLELVNSEIPERGKDLRDLREALLRNKKSERRILSIVRDLPGRGNDSAQGKDPDRCAGGGYVVRKSQGASRALLAPDRQRSLTSAPLTVRAHLADFLVVDAPPGRHLIGPWGRP